MADARIAAEARAIGDNPLAAESDGWRDRASSAERDLAAVIDMSITARSPIDGGGYVVETPVSPLQHAETYAEAVASVRRAAGLDGEGKP